MVFHDSRRVLTPTLGTTGLVEAEKDGNDLETMFVLKTVKSLVLKVACDLGVFESSCFFFCVPGESRANGRGCGCVHALQQHICKVLNMMSCVGRRNAPDVLRFLSLYLYR